ncbi:MAG: hypothetical protein PHU25_21760 [Deltaproteobacteria bacterium]|nr:hypothetical protein [Deltaproteobacteria bacterium]
MTRQTKTTEPAPAKNAVSTDIADRLRNFPLRGFPHIASCCPRSVLTSSNVYFFLSQYEQQYEQIKTVFSSYELSCVDDCLGRLIPDFLPDTLWEQIDALWSDKERDWDKATTELLGLDYLHSRNVLESIGWPRGGTPPFDARVSLPSTSRNEHYILVDIKTASGRGSVLVRDKLQKVAEEWATSKGLGNPVIEERGGGNLTLDSVGGQLFDKRQLHGIVSSFRAQLEGYSQFPRERILVIAQGCSFRINVRPYAEITYHGSVPWVDAMTSSIAQRILKHAKDKSQHAQKERISCILLYVLPDGKETSDINDDILCRAMEIADEFANKDADKYSEWLGIAFLDWNRTFKARGYFRNGARWPKGLSSSSVCLALGLTEWTHERS